MQEQKLKFGVTCAQLDKDMWSLGIALSYSYNETYLYINLFKLSISIGKFYH
jgi:hypothetical protein